MTTVPESAPEVLEPAHPPTPESFYDILEDQAAHVGAITMMNGLANAWLGIKRERVPSAWEEVVANSSYSGVDIPLYKALLWRLRVPQLLTAGHGWALWHEDGPQAGPGAMVTHPLTGRPVAALKPGYSWKFKHESEELYLHLITDRDGEVFLQFYYPHTFQAEDVARALEELYALVEEPNLYEGQVCLLTPGAVEVLHPHELVTSPYADEVEAAVEWLLKIADPEVCAKLQAVGLPARAGLLLEGPPGSGKTTLARRVAYSLAGQVTTVYASPEVDASDVVEFAKSFKKCLVVFEDVENFMGHRGEDEFSDFLNAMDGVVENSIMFLATTNDSSDFDPAVRRPGRLERRVVISSIHPAATRQLVASRFPSYSEEELSLVLELAEQRLGRLTEVPPAVLDSLARHIIMLDVQPADFKKFIGEEWQPSWRGASYVEDASSAPRGKDAEATDPF